MADPKIKIRRSATPNKVPTKDQLQLGELAINTYDGKLYLEQDQGGVGVGTTVIAVNPWGVGIGSTAYNTQFTAGKVGVGTTNAQYNLDVGGDINFTGNLYQDGSAFTSGVGIRTAGGTVGWAATIIDFRGPGVTTAYYSSSTGIGTVYFQGGGGGGGNASVTVSDSAPSSPSNGDLWFKSDVGELYLWYTDGSSNQWVEASGGSNTVVTSDTAPSSPQDGDLWWNSDTGELKVYYNDGNSSQWVDANSEGGFIQYWTQTNTNGNLGVTTTGFVGIGTTTATDALTVVGAADIDGNLIVSGVSTFQDDLRLPDDKKIKLGNSDDFQMYHQSSSTEGTYITNSAGQLTFKNTAANQHTYIHGDRVHLRSTTGNETYLTANHNGRVDLFYDNTKRFETTSTGVSVTGDLAASGNVTGVAATFTGNVTVGGVLTYEDVKNVDAIGVVTARTGIKVLAGGATIVDGTTTDNLNVTGITTFAGITTSTGTIFGKQLSISGISTLKNTIVGGATTELIVHGDARVTGVLSVGQGSLSINERDIYAVGVFTGANFKTGTSNLHSAGVEVAGVNVLGADTPVGLGATVYNSGLIVGKQGAEFQGVVTASSFHGSGADLTDVISGVGIGTEGGVVGYAATIIHFKGAGVTTAYYNASTGIGTVFFHSATTGGGGGANVTVSDTPPGSPSAGDLWWESDIGELKIYYSDGDSAQWVDASGADSLVQIGTSAPTGAVSGDLWFNSESGDFMVYYTDANSSAWVSVNAINDNVLWKTNSTGIHTSSYVGIGTTTVTDPLTVVGAADIDGRLIVSGITTFGSHVYHGDNDHAIFGDGSDLSIYHDGSHSYIKDNGTGSLKVLTNLLHVRNASDNSTLAKFTTNGANELYFSSNKKFETTNTGVSITGNNVVSGNVTAVDGTLSGDLDVDGHTNLDNVSIAGVTTFANNARFSGDVNIVGTLTYEDVKNVDSVGIATARQGLRITGGGLDVVGISTFANSIDANNSLDVAGDVSIADKIVHTGDTNTLIRFPAAGIIRFDTDGDERLRITDSGYLGIKRSTPLANLHTTNNELAIGANPASAAAPNATYDGLVVDGSAGTWINIRSRGDGNVAYGRLAFSDDTRGRGHIEYRHKDGSGDDWMGFQTAGSERLRIDSSGRLLVGRTSVSNSDSKMEIQGSTDTYLRIASGNTGGSAGVIFGSSDDHSTGGIYYANVDDSLQFAGYNNTTRLTITAAGDIHQQWRDGAFFGTKYDSDYYMGLTFGVSSRTLFIDNRSNDTRADIVFRTIEAQSAPAERLRITSVGKVSIGNLTSPDSLLHIHDGSAGSIAASSAAKLTIESSASDYNVLQFLSPSSAAQQIRFGDASDNGAGWIQYNHNGNALTFGANGPERLRLDSNGNLGIGDNGPTNFTNYTNLSIHGPSGGAITFGDDGTDEWEIYGGDGAVRIYDRVNTTERLRIDSNGNIGVNCNSPTNISGHKGITLKGTNANAGFINFMDSADNSDARILATDGELHIHADISDNTGSSEVVFFVDNSRKACITDAGLLLLGTSDIAFSTGYTTMTIGNTSTQNTGLTIASSPSNGLSRVHFADGNSGTARYAGWIAYDHSIDEMKFSTGGSGSYKVSIDAGGRLSLGGLDASTYYPTYNQFVMGSTTGSAGMTLVSKNDSAGYITWADGTSGADQYRGRIFYSHGDDSFNLRCNGQTSNILTINSSALLVGKTTTSQTSDNGLILHNNGNISYAQDGSGNHDFAEFYRGTSGSYSRVGYIRTNGSSTTYSTSSDYRLKENEVLISDGIARLKTLKPYRFNFKEDSSTTVDGFFAHEVESAVPEAVSGEKDGEEMQGMDYGRITPLLTAALQEAIAKIETLEAEVAALKSS